MQEAIPTVQGMVIANPCFISTIRTTMVDIMCTTNSAKFSTIPKVAPSREALLVTLPYEKVKTLTFEGTAKANTRFQKLKNDVVNQRKMEDLRKDRELFFQKQRLEKQEIDKIKRLAATKIQAAFRGYRVRPKYGYVPCRKKLHKYTQNEMQDELCNLAIALSLKPIPGLSLEARTKASRRKLRIENAAAFRIQRFFRMIFNRKLAMVVVKTKLKEKHNKSSRVITKAIRFLITKKFVKRVELIKRERSVVVVQAYVRKFLANKRVKDILKINQKLWKHNEAAIIIQRNLGERHRGKLRLARATMSSLRSFRKLVDLVMEAIASAFLDTVLDQYVDSFVASLLSLRDTVLENVQDRVLEEEVESVLAVGIEQHVCAMLAAIEEEKRRLAEERRQVEERMSMAAEEDAQRAVLEAQRLAQRLKAEKEKKRVGLYRVQKARVVEAHVHQLVSTAVSRHVARDLEARRARAFTSAVLHTVHHVVHTGRAQAASELLVHYLRDLAQQTSLVIQDVASRTAEDSISVVLSLFSDRLSFFQQAVDDLVSAAGDVVDDNGDGGGDGGGQEVHRPHPVDEDGSTAGRVSLEDELHSVVMEVDDDNDDEDDEDRAGEGGQGRGASSSSSPVPRLHTALGQSLSSLVKDVRSAAVYYTQGRYEAAVQDLQTPLRLLETRLAAALAASLPEAVVVKLGVLLSVLVQLQARALFALARYDAVWPLLQEVRAIRAEALDRRHYLVAEEWTVRADWHRALGQYPDAMVCLDTADDLLRHEMGFYEARLSQADTQRGHLSLAVFKTYHRALLCRVEVLRHTGQYYQTHTLLQRVEEHLQRFKQAGLSSFEVEEDFLSALLALSHLAGRRTHTARWQHTLYTQRQRRYRDRHPKVATSLCTLGRLAWDGPEGSAAALESIHDGLRMRYEVYPPDHPAVAAGHLLKARAYIAHGCGHEAFLEAVRALHAFQQIFGSLAPGHASVASSLSVLAHAQVTLGEPLLAHQSLAQALDSFRRLFAVDLHDKINQVRSLQALAWIQQGHYLQALACLSEVIEQRERMLQALHADRRIWNATSTSTSTSVSLSVFVDPAAAVEATAAAAAGGPPPATPEEVSVPIDLLLARAARAYCWVCTGQLHLALETLPGAVHALVHALPSHHPYVAQAYGWLSHLCQQRGNFLDARTLCGKAFAGMADRYPHGHPLLFAVYVHNADTLRQVGFYDESLEISGAGLALATQVFAQSPSNVLTAHLLLSRAEALRDAGLVVEAEPMFLQALNLLRQKAGATSGVFAQAVVALAEQYHAQQRWVLAERHYLQALPLLAQTAGEHSLRYELALGGYALLLMDVHHWQEAADLLHDEVLPHTATVLSDRHPWRLYLQANGAVLQYLLQPPRPLDLQNLDSLEDLAATLHGLPAVQDLLAFWESAGFSTAHPWIQRMTRLPTLLHTSLMASTSTASTSGVFDTTPSTSTYGTGRASLTTTTTSTSSSSARGLSREVGSYRSALSVISEREESLASYGSLSPSLTETDYGGETDTRMGSVETASQSSQSVGGSYYDYDVSHASASHLFSPRSLSYTSRSLSPRSGFEGGSSLDGSPRSILTGQSSTIAASLSPSVMESQTRSSRQSQLINVEESTLGSWEQPTLSQSMTSGRDTFLDDASDVRSLLYDSVLDESVRSDLDSLTPR